MSKKTLPHIIIAAVIVLTMAAILLVRNCGRKDNAGGHLPEAVSVLIDDMIDIEGGQYKMGATKEQGDTVDLDEQPVHKVNVEDFLICRYEVTQKLWTTIMDYNPSRFKGDDYPVENVSYDSCLVFIERLNELTGMSFRLPTEAEWEYCARGGKDVEVQYRFSGADDADSVAWYVANSQKTTHAVGGKNPNSLGLYDMSGNVSEWCSDDYQEYEKGDPNVATLPKTVGSKVVRGGSWRSSLDDLRVARRAYHSPDTTFPYVGLRLALEDRRVRRQ